MSRDQQRLTDYLAHILEAIERIGRYTEDLDAVAFLGNEMAQDAVIRNLEIIGEASHNIEGHYPDFAAAHPELPLPSPIKCATPWRTGISRWLEIVWKTLQNDLPGLYQQVQAVRHALAQGGEAR